MKDFYEPYLEMLGYSIDYTYRSQKDAVVVGYKRNQYQLLSHEPVDYNDIVDIFKDPVMGKNNKALISLLKHVG